MFFSEGWALQFEINTWLINRFLFHKMQSSLCFTGQQEPKPEWMSAGTAQLICWAGPSLELLRDTEACGCKDAEVWIAAYLKNLGREILHLYKKLFAVFGIYRCPRRDLLLCLCRKMFPVAFQTSIIMLCVALGKPWSRMMASLEPALGDFSQPCFVCRGGWDQEGDSSVTVQWLSSKCHGVLGLEFVGGLWHPCDISAAAAWAAEGSAGQSLPQVALLCSPAELGAAAVSLSVPKSALWRLR